MQLKWGYFTEKNILSWKVYFCGAKIFFQMVYHKNPLKIIQSKTEWK